MPRLINDKCKITGELWGGGNYSLTGDCAIVAATGPNYDPDSYWVHMQSGRYIGQYILVHDSKLTKV